MNDLNAAVPPLPELHSAILDEETLQALVRDVHSMATHVAVTVKGRATAHSDGRVWPLDDAVEAFERGDVLGVQVRYRHSGRTWCDTLIRTPVGVRLVRIAEDRIAVAASSGVGLESE